MKKHVMGALDLKDKLSAQGEELEDTLVSAFLLRSFSDLYNSLITGIESRPKYEITLDFIKGKLFDEYRRRIENQSATHSESATKVTSSGKTYQQKKLICHFCQKEETKNKSLSRLDLIHMFVKRFIQ